MYLKLWNYYIFIAKKQRFSPTFRMMKSEPDNSWCVSTIEEFLYYCCPDCDVKMKLEDKENFVRHALSEHPASATYIGQLIIKEELVEDDQEIYNTNDDIGESFEYLPNVDPLNAYYSADNEPIGTDSLTPKKVNMYFLEIAIKIVATDWAQMEIPSIFLMVSV